MNARVSVDDRQETFMERVLTKISHLETTIEGLRVAMGNIMSRADIEAADSKRVAHETYVADQRRVDERITRLESGPQKTILVMARSPAWWLG